MVPTDGVPKEPPRRPQIRRADILECEAGIGLVQFPRVANHRLKVDSTRLREVPLDDPFGGKSGRSAAVSSEARLRRFELLGVSRSVGFASMVNQNSK